eukprot:5905246-Amphidinium_carterae.1
MQVKLSIHGLYHVSPQCFRAITPPPKRVYWHTQVDASASFVPQLVRPCPVFWRVSDLISCGCAGLDCFWRG